MGTKIINTNDHRASTRVGGEKVLLSAGEVREFSGEQLDAVLLIPGVRTAGKGDEANWRDAANYRDTGGGQTVSAPSGSTSALTTEDVATLKKLSGTVKQGLVRDNVEVAQQPSLPATGGGELPAVADGKAALDRAYDPAAGSDDAEVAATADPLDGFDVEQLKVYASETGVDIGNATSQAGILKKIREAQAAGREEASKPDADGTQQADGSAEVASS